jgi:adenylate cyclase
VNLEIERKYLLRDAHWKNLGQGVLLRQGYLSSHRERIVRVRIEGDAAVMTIKGRTVGASRGEWEYPIPLDDARIFLDELCEKPIIEKTRYRIPYRGMVWEVDEFHGENAGLVVAEIELTSEDQLFDKPDWIGEEVTHDPRYANANLLRHPYSKW